jgi:hypothetical protein
MSDDVMAKAREISIQRDGTVFGHFHPRLT